MSIGSFEPKTHQFLPSAPIMMLKYKASKCLLLTSQLSLLLPEFANWLVVDRDIAHSTLSHHKYQLGVILSKITSWDIQELKDFIFELKQTKSAGTVENYIFTMRVFGDFLTYKKLQDYNVCKELHLPKRIKKPPVILSLEEVKKLIDQDLPLSYFHYPNPADAKITFNLLFHLLAVTGCRCGEITSLTTGQIDWENQVIRLETSKTRQGRLIPIPPECVYPMQLLCKDKKSDVLIFKNPKSGLKISNQVLGVNWRLRLREAGITKHATVHTLRHSFITELLTHNISIAKLAVLVGHENVQQTMDYSKLLVEDIRSVVLAHPICAINRNPYDILKDIKEAINKYHLNKDPRFSFKVTEMENMLQISVMIV